ncbi:hypothetical protein KKH23_04865 [Patescibacteria group bacterium]|nr:hypothetical protein [Patescibacteria group bacterium]
MYNPYRPSTKKQAIVASSKASLTSGDASVPRAVSFAPRKSGNQSVSAEPMIASDGSFNAYNKQDLYANMSALQRSVSSGTILTAATQEAQAANERQLKTALADKSGDTWMALGEVLGEEIWETLGREGFARKTLMLKELDRGEIGRVAVRRKDVVAYYTTANPNVVAAQVRQKYVLPPEFSIVANILIEDKEIAQAPGDILEDKFQDGLEQIMVTEDKIWLQLARTAAVADNDLVYFNTFTPTVFTSLRTSIAEWGIPVTTAIIAFDIWNDIIADHEFSAWFDPVTKHEIVLEGSLGSIQGVNLITDGYRYDTLQVLQAGEIFFLGSPQTLGAIVQRAPLTTNPVNHYALGKAERGWFMQQIEGMAIVNPKAIIRAQRV